MAREFTRNMFIMLVSIMVGAVIITFFVGDIMNRSKIETLTEQHIVEISDINSRNENFTNYFFQGAVKMDSAREVREVANYHFDFALYLVQQCVSDPIKISRSSVLIIVQTRCKQYLGSHENFGKSKPYFEIAKNFTNNSRYLEVLGYYIGFARAGQNITMLRYNASDYLRRAAENLSFGHMENVTLLHGELHHDRTSLPRGNSRTIRSSDTR